MRATGPIAALVMGLLAAGSAGAAAPSEAAARKVLAATPLKGPFRALKDWCKTVDSAKACELSKHSNDRRTIAGSPFLEIALLEYQGSVPEQEEAPAVMAEDGKAPPPAPPAKTIKVPCQRLVLRTAAGWFVAAEESCSGGRGIRSLSLESASPAKARDAALLLHVARSQGNGHAVHREHQLLVAGVGKSGRPSLTPPLHIYGETQEDVGGPKKTAGSFEVQADGSILLQPRGETVMPTFP